MKSERETPAVDVADANFSETSSPNFSMERREARHAILRLITGETDAGSVRCCLAALVYCLAWPASFWTAILLASLGAHPGDLLELVAIARWGTLSWFAVVAPSWIVSRYFAEPEGRGALGATMGAGSALLLFLLLVGPHFSWMARTREDFVSALLGIVAIMVLFVGLFVFLPLWVANRYLSRFDGVAR